jgi:hypothetical protein
MFLREHTRFCFGSILGCFDFFNMHARRPIGPHTAIKPKIEVSAGDKAFIRLSL